MTIEFQLKGARKDILKHNGHLLIEGGPGAGKTTIALLKAKKIIDDSLIDNNQKILFLSFARATISRVEEQARDLISSSDKKKVEINTYHSFAWSIIQSFGYLLKRHNHLKLITPPNLSARMADLDDAKREEFKIDLLEREGIICFDLFSSTAVSILNSSQKIRSIYSNAYPYIIVDEFQDTDDSEWKLIKLLGQKSRIIALADMNQRIYEFRGASISRLPQFKEHFEANIYDLGIENNRSPGTDIVDFGNDLLKGTNIGKVYKNVVVSRYQPYREVKSNLKYALIKSIQRLKACAPSGDWSIAVLVKTKQDTLSVSSYLSSQNLQHEVLIDPAGPTLAASVISQVLEYDNNTPDIFFKHLLTRIINHIKGRKTSIAQADLELCHALEKYQITGKITGPKRNRLVEEVRHIVINRGQMAFKGIPEEDWISVRKLFCDCSHEVLKNIFTDAQYLRLLNKGAQLSEKLSEMWRTLGNYSYASQAVEEALEMEHFSMSHRVWRGIVVMNIHKSKGKEFDEVLIWEDPFRPIVHPKSSETRLQQDRLLIRVAATRAKRRTTFLTPSSSPCILL